MVAKEGTHQEWLLAQLGASLPDTGDVAELTENLCVAVYDGAVDVDVAVSAPMDPDKLCRAVRNAPAYRAAKTVAGSSDPELLRRVLEKERRVSVLTEAIENPHLDRDGLEAAANAAHGNTTLCEVLGRSGDTTTLIDLHGEGHTLPAGTLHRLVKRVVTRLDNGDSREVEALYRVLTHTSNGDTQGPEQDSGRTDSATLGRFAIAVAARVENGADVGAWPVRDLVMELCLRGHSQPRSRRVPGDVGELRLGKLAPLTRTLSRGEVRRIAENVPCENLCTALATAGAPTAWVRDLADQMSHADREVLAATLLQAQALRPRGGGSLQGQTRSLVAYVDALIDGVPEPWIDGHGGLTPAGSLVAELTGREDVASDLADAQVPRLQKAWADVVALGKCHFNHRVPTDRLSPDAVLALPVEMLTADEMLAAVGRDDIADDDKHRMVNAAKLGMEVKAASAQRERRILADRRDRRNDGPAAAGVQWVAERGCAHAIALFADALASEKDREVLQRRLADDDLRRQVIELAEGRSWTWAAGPVLLPVPLARTMRVDEVQGKWVRPGTFAETVLRLRGHELPADTLATLFNNCGGQTLSEVVYDRLVDNGNAELVARNDVKLTPEQLRRAVAGAEKVVGVLAHQLLDHVAEADDPDEHQLNLAARWYAGTGTSGALRYVSKTPNPRLCTRILEEAEVQGTLGSVSTMVADAVCGKDNESASRPLTEDELDRVSLNVEEFVRIRTGDGVAPLAQQVAVHLRRRVGDDPQRWRTLASLRKHQPFAPIRRLIELLDAVS